MGDLTCSRSLISDWLIKTEYACVVAFIGHFLHNHLVRFLLAKTGM